MCGGGEQIDVHVYECAGERSKLRDGAQHPSRLFPLVLACSRRSPCLSARTRRGERSSREEGHGGDRRRRRP